MTTEYERWLDAYEAACSAPGVAQTVECPHCASRGLNMAFVAFEVSVDAVMPAFWCSSCLHGLAPLRAPLPPWATAVAWEESALPDYTMVAETEVDMVTSGPRWIRGADLPLRASMSFTQPGSDADRSWLGADLLSPASRRYEPGSEARQMPLGELMIETCWSEHAAEVKVEFDEYVPVTVTWPESGRLLDQPVYWRCASGQAVLELKFHPSSRRIVEAVLVNAPNIRLVAEALAPRSNDERATVCFPDRVGSEGSGCAELIVTAFEDCLLISLSNGLIVQWVGGAPVYFGQDSAGDVVALCVLWSPRDRALVMGLGLNP